MHDFAKTSHKRTGFSTSPFTAYKRQQQRRVVALLMQKISIVFFWVGISFALSCSIIAFYLLKTATWNRSEPVGIAILTSQKGQILKDTTLVWIDPMSRELRLLSMPGNLNVHTPQSGTYTLTALYGLFALDHDTPDQFLKSLVRNVRIDMPFLIMKEGVSAPTVDALRGFLLRSFFDTRGLYTYSLSDRFAIFWFTLFGNARSVGVPFPQTVSASEQGLDDVGYDTFVQKNFANAGIKREGLSVAIVNASSQRRLASTVGRLFSVLGLNVLSVSDTPNVQDQGSIVISSGKILKSGTVRLLARYVGNTIRVSPDIVSQYRSDIVVFLGKTESVVFTP